MEAQEFDSALSDLETRVDRLRALYENWFRGYEKAEPGVARKDVERRVYALRKELPRNTALRFRYHQLYQRYTTLATYWQRTARQIEEGTYRLQLKRIKRRKHDDDARPSVAPASVRAPENARPSSDSLDETLNVHALLDELEIERVAKAITRSAPPPSAPPPSVEPGTGRFARPSMNPTGLSPLALGASGKSATFGRPNPGSSDVVPLPRGASARFPRPDAASARPSVAPVARDGAGSLHPPPAAPAGSAPGRRERSEPRPAASGALSVPPTNANAQPFGRPSAAPTGVMPLPPPHPSVRASGAPTGLMPLPGPHGGVASLPSAAPTGLMPQPLPAAPRPGASAKAGVVKPSAGVAKPPVPPPLRPSLPSVGSSTPLSGAGPLPREGANSSGAQPRAAEKLPGAGSALPSPRQVGLPAGAAAQASGSAKLGSGAGEPPAVPSARAAVPPARTAIPPARPPAVPKAPALPQQAPAAFRARAEGEGAGALSEQRMKRIYDEYAAARRRNNEAEVRFETLAHSIQKMLPDLHKKHHGKQIDFEVVLKDGRVGLRPKAT